MRIRLLSQNNTNTLFICRYIGTRKNDLWNFRKWTMFQLRGMPLDTPPITNQSKSRSNRTCPKTPAWQDDFDQAYEKRNIKFAQCCSTNVFLWEPFLLQLIIYFFSKLSLPSTVFDMKFERVSIYLSYIQEIVYPTLSS